MVSRWFPGPRATALVVPVPAADHVVPTVAGMPPHITVLYPFLPPARISDRLLASLGRLFAGVAAFEFKLDRIGWFGEEVVWLGPRDPTPFSILTSLTFTAFPSCPPYGGQFPDPRSDRTSGAGW